MDLTIVLRGLEEDLRRAAAVGGADTERLAELLVSSSEAAIRLRILEILTAAARELEQSAPGVTIDIRLEGHEPVLSIVEAGRPTEEGAGEKPAGSYLDDELVRLTIRLPERLKNRVEEAAGGSGTSINAWIVAALARSLEMPSSSRVTTGRRLPRRITGFIQT